MSDWTPALGARFDGQATTFRVWAPDRDRLDLVVDPAPGRQVETGPRPLERDATGYWVGRFADLTPGARYRYRLDGRDDLTFPDPASRYQPDGVHGASEVVDPAAFAWRHDGWQPPPLRDVVLYELHVGTFTPEGTFRAAMDRLPYVAELGVTMIELMPVADFAGSRNWGYDGVALFAPARCYGTPDDLRAVIDAAHGHGLGVFMDVVYNHLGPDGAYANAFSPYYFVDTHTAWGAGVNLDGPHSPEVRRFFTENALHWAREYHVDGLRLDATHAMRDSSRAPFLRELAATVRAHAPRPVLVVAEDHRNLAQMLRPADHDGWGLDGVWADDFHHQVRVHTAGDREGYYGDYTGTIEDLATTIRQGWFYTGQHSAHLGEARGTSAEGLRPAQFVIWPMDTTTSDARTTSSDHGCGISTLMSTPTSSMARTAAAFRASPGSDPPENTSIRFSAKWRIQPAAICDRPAL
jgi:maltooligosyltrehalose trehalohydrolase